MIGSLCGVPLSDVNDCSCSISYDETIDVRQFVRTLACFRPAPNKRQSKRDVEETDGADIEPNSREAKLKCLH